MRHLRVDMPPKKRDEAVNALKASLVQRFGAASRDVVEAEIEGRLAASGFLRLSREDLDAIEQGVLAATRQRRGGGASRQRLAGSRSAPSLAVGGAALVAAGAQGHGPGMSQSQAAPALSRAGSSSGASLRPSPPGRPASGGSGAASAFGRRRRGSAEPARGPPLRGPTGAFFLSPKNAAPSGQDRGPKPPYGVTVIGDDDTESEHMRVKVNPRFPVPPRPKLKHMDHWDLIVAFDGFKYKQENDGFQNVGRANAHSKFRATLDQQMDEINTLREQEAEERRRERDDMLAAMEENRRLKEAEEAAQEAQRIRVKDITDEMLQGIEARRQREKDRVKREEQQMTAWLENEKRRKQEEDRRLAKEHAQKCEQAKAEMLAAIEDAKRRKKAREEAEKAYVAEQQKGMDDKEAANRAAVQARMDQIERNCATVGADIAARDAKAERELQEKVRRVQEEADRAAKEDAERRKSEHDRKTRAMLASLDEQCKQRDVQARADKVENTKQAQRFKEEYEAGLAKDRAEAEARRLARSKLDETLVDQMRAQLQVHPRNFGITCTTQQTDVAYNQALFEHMRSEGFLPDLTGQILSHGPHRGKRDPFPSVGRYEGPIHPAEMQEVDAAIVG